MKRINRLPNRFYAGFSVILWGLIWHFAAVYTDNILFLPKPADVMNSFIMLMSDAGFWEIAAKSALNIMKGFLLSVGAGILFACLSAFNFFMKSFIEFPMKIIKSTPVASFTILALLWVSSENLSVLVSFLMGLPIIYTNVLQGIETTDEKLLEMSRIFRFGAVRRARYVYAANIAPYFMSACSITAGMCWKSGIAAELIGITRNSIGNKLYMSKLHLEIPELFAYTCLIIILSIIFEKSAILIFRLLSDIITHSAPAKKFQRAGLRTKKHTAQISTAPCTIELLNISKAYGDHKVFDNLTLTFADGSTTAIMSPSGAGKTTLVNIIAGIVQADGGHAVFSEKPYISMVFQENRLLNQCDIITNLFSAIGSASRSSAENSALDKELASLGLENSAFFKISSLSGGMKRRVAILRALLSPSNIVILDEPFKGLDAELKKDVMDYVKKRTAGKTVLLITHDISEAEFFTDKIITLPPL